MITAIHNDAVRVTKTPNAMMTTLASPTLGGTQQLSLWKVRMQPGASSPVHTFDTEQVWHLIEGNVTIEIDGTIHSLTAGDTLHIPGTASRQIRAETSIEFIVCGQADARVISGAPGGEPITPAWIA